MKQISPLVIAITITLAGHTFAQDESARIVDKRAIKLLLGVDDMWRGESSEAVFSMTVKTKNYTRSMKMRAWSRGKEKTLVTILRPKKERGTASLKSGENIYTYLPKTDRTIRLTSGMMMGSWMGSHLTNDDLVKESRLTEDFIVEITFEGKRDEAEVIDFRLTPKPDAAVVWGKVELTLVKNKNSSRYLPTIETYFDEDLVVARTITFSDIKNLGGIILPAMMKVVPADKPEESTVIYYDEMAFDVDLPDDFFSLASLRKK